jgi:hypothetical protein
MSLPVRLASPGAGLISKLTADPGNVNRQP